MQLYHIEITLICACFISASTAVFYENEADLMKNLLQDYDPGFRPVLQYSTSLNVSLGVQIRRVESLDEQNEILTVTSEIHLVWRDEKLSWDLTQTNNISFIAVPHDRVWTPLLAVLNSVKGEDNNAVLTDHCHCQLTNDGQIACIPIANLQTACNINLSKFPFDTQHCTIFFYFYKPDSYIYPSAMLIHDQHGAEKYYTNKHEWAILEQHLTRETIPGYNTSILPQTVILKRNPTFYVVFLLIPSILMAFLSVLVFLLPPECGERIGLSITILLSYTVFLLTVSEVTPRGGTNLSVLVIYITMMEILAGVILVANVLVIRLENSRSKTVVSPEDEAAAGNSKSKVERVDWLLFLITFSFVATSTVMLLCIILS